jgi:hypothetical protein
MFRDNGMPAYLIKEMNELDTQKFEIGLNHWMDHFNFIGHPTTIAAYDEGRYPNANNKPSFCRPKNNGRRVNLSLQRNQAIVFACQAFLEYFQHQRLHTMTAQ